MCKFVQVYCFFFLPLLVWGTLPRLAETPTSLVLMLLEVSSSNLEGADPSTVSSHTHPVALLRTWLFLFWTPALWSFRKSHQISTLSSEIVAPLSHDPLFHYCIPGMSIFSFRVSARLPHRPSSCFPDITIFFLASMPYDAVAFLLQVSSPPECSSFLGSSC